VQGLDGAIGVDSLAPGSIVGENHRHVVKEGGLSVAWTAA
jgi:hypothetical protein